MRRKCSDISITSECGIIDLLERGENVMADHGFEIQELLEPKGVALNIQPLLGEAADGEGSDRNAVISKFRFHIEWAIGRMISYRILQDVVPLSLASQASDIFTTVFHIMFISN